MTDSPPPAKPHLPDAQTVTAVRHWTDRLFSFRVTPPAVAALPVGRIRDDRPDGRQRQSRCCAPIPSPRPSWDEELEFYSIKVPDGPLTSQLQHIQPGDEIILRPKPVGTLVHDALLPGKRLWFLATGTGLRPLRQPDARPRDL